ncbi:ATP-binding cassette domain-containing protein [bacterium]|nr:ATP-binding cassette domain-containing protein [bacterium]
MAQYTNPRLETRDYKDAKWQLVEMMLEKLDFKAVERLPAEHKRDKIRATATALLPQLPTPLNAEQHELLKSQILDEILGFGPLEPLIRDVDVSDIMVNTAQRIYIEKKGKLFSTDLTFVGEKHLLNTIQKIVSLVGRRVDESSPMVDARMPDGSRFNAIIPPLSIDGSLVSIRKFKKNKMPLSGYLQYGSMTAEMVKFLEICGNIRLNILVSGGTGSGKTTLLNALSGNIDVTERVITIEDAAELQLHQPHVLRLETRPPNSEGVGEVTQRLLVKNALRMRPDRIILGEIRGDEVIDVLAAMNTGHEGSMATIHANNPRDCLSRLENLIALSGIQLPLNAMRAQISSAIHVICQLSRMRDGRRRITHIEEVVGMEGTTITTQLLFGYKPGPMGPDGVLQGEFFYTGIKPRFYEQAAYFNRARDLDECLRAAKAYERAY